MTLLILSDSHGRPDHVAEVIRRTRPDGILFAGDGLRDLSYDLPAPAGACPLWAVRGNCDWMTAPLVIGGAVIEPSDEELVTVEGIRILLMHGHKYGVKSGLGTAIAHAVRCDADVLVFGHTHTPIELHLSPDRTYDFPVTKPLTVFNPGSLGDRNASFGTLTIRNGQMLFGHGEL
ncbi:MAG: metallophosphoesterase family protein [Clostridia bacterium]|nr:metallophosphoesterase family protein [Clostridia bacterium]